MCVCVLVYGCMGGGGRVCEGRGIINQIVTRFPVDKWLHP